LKEEQVNQIKTILSLKKLGHDAFLTTWDKIKVKQDYEYLVCVVLDKLWHLWELDKLTDSGQILKVSTSVMSEILAINRAISPSSDFKVCTWYERTILPILFKVTADVVNPTRIYRTLDKLFLKEEDIQNHLAKKIKELGFGDLSLVFYDITSSYFEGCCPLGEFGLSRDHRKDRPQLLLALAITKEGFSFYWKVLPWELHDSLTVKEAVTSLKKRFQLKDIILVMDKGMISEDNLKFLEKEGFSYIVSIARSSVKKLSSFPKELLTRLGEELEKESEKKEVDLEGVMKKYPYFTYLSPRAYFHELKKEGKRRYVLIQRSC